MARYSLAVLLAALAFVKPARAQSSLWGRPVADILLECDARLRFEDFAGRITQRVGEPLDASKVSESLKNLYATGRFRELRVDAESKDSGVELVFVGRARFFAGTVRVQGAPESLDPRGLASAARLRLGQSLSDEDLADAQRRLAAVFAENGYHRAQVIPRTLERAENQVADVVFSVAPGEAAILSAVDFQGKTVFPPQRLMAVAGWRLNRHLTSARLEQGLFKIHQYYVKRGRLQATTNVRKRDFDPVHNTEKLLLQVEAGPQVKVRVGGAPISTSKKRQLLPMFMDGVTDDFAVQQGERNLEDYFERQGYYSVSAKGARTFRSGSDQIDITYKLNLGSDGEFAGYAFEGNRAFPAAELAKSLSMQPKTFLHDRGTFSRDLLARDANALATLYQSRGFLEVRVTPRLNTRYKGRENRLFITFEIEEGPQTKVGELVLHGVDAQTQENIWPFLLTKAGQPCSPERARTDSDSIGGYFADRGYSSATVSWTTSPASAPHRVRLEYEIRPGEQEKVGQIVLMGNQQSRSGIIRRELAFGMGGPLSQSSVLASQRQLYDLGVFNQVQIAAQDTGSTEDLKTVLVSVEESRRWTVGFGGGLEVQRLGGNQPEGQYRASPRLSLDISRLNVGGRAQTFTLRGRLSNLEKGGALSYLIPHFSTHRDLNLHLYGLVDRSRDVLTFTAERQEASISLEKRYSPAALLLGRVSFRRVLVDPSTLRIRPEDVPLVSRPARVAMISTSYINDHRDNPADATRGSYSLADAGISAQTLGSQADFVRFSGQNATYYRLGPHLIFARNSRFAVETTYGHGGPRGQIPLPERFFMGGSESHRGFSINQAGPRDSETGFPLGGNALFINSLELRLPFEENRFGVVLFHDTGNVFSTVRKLRLLKVSQNSPTDLDYTIHAVGAGFRYKTPVGPLRFDVGYDFNPPRFQVLEKGGLEVRRLSKFQFFLGVGQSF